MTDELTNDPEFQPINTPQEALAWVTGLLLQRVPDVLKCGGSVEQVASHLEDLAHQLRNDEGLRERLWRQAIIPDFTDTDFWTKVGEERRSSDG